MPAAHFLAPALRPAAAVVFPRGRWRLLSPGLRTASLLALESVCARNHQASVRPPPVASRLSRSAAPSAESRNGYRSVFLIMYSMPLLYACTVKHSRANYVKVEPLRGHSSAVSFLPQQGPTQMLAAFQHSRHPDEDGGLSCAETVLKLASNEAVSKRALGLTRKNLYTIPKAIEHRHRFLITTISHRRATRAIQSRPNISW